MLRSGFVISAVPDLVELHARKLDGAGHHLERQNAGIVLGKVPADRKYQIGARQQMRCHTEERDDYPCIAGESKIGKVFIDYTPVRR